jgi:hypothetical protein
MRLADLLARTSPLITAFLLNLLSSSAQAQIPHETLYFEGLPTDDLVALWSTQPGTRSYVIRAGTVYGEELKPLARLRGADRILVEVDHYPSESGAVALEIWRKLAGQGVEFVMMGHQDGFPTSQEIETLNSAGFSRCTFAIPYLPSPEEGKRLGRLTCKLSLTFAVRAYPKYTDREGLASVPEQVPLLFSTDYWPWYTHMDTFNLLPHRKRLRVADSLPTDESLPYLKGIRLLDDVQLSTRFDVTASDWSRLSGLPLTWQTQGHVPSQEALAAFAAVGRKLIIDSDLPLTTEERDRLARSPLPVEWISAAPRLR